MIKRSTWIVLAILAIIVALFIYLNERPVSQSEATPTATNIGYLVTRGDRTVSNIEISDLNGNVVRIGRDGSGTWQMELPVSGEADQALAEATDTQLFALRILSTLEGTQTPYNMVGLDSPAFQITVRFTDGLNQVILVGSQTPTGSGYYVLFERKIYVISKYGMDALINILESPPYAPTETPTPGPASETPSPEGTPAEEGTPVIPTP